MTRLPVKLVSPSRGKRHIVSPGWVMNRFLGNRKFMFCDSRCVLGLKIWSMAWVNVDEKIVFVTYISHLCPFMGFEMHPLSLCINNTVNPFDLTANQNLISSVSRSDRWTDGTDKRPNLGLPLISLCRTNHVSWQQPDTQDKRFSCCLEESIAKELKSSVITRRLY